LAEHTLLFEDALDILFLLSLPIFAVAGFKHDLESHALVCDEVTDGVDGALGAFA
jgi:hypothetical protein